MVPQDVINEMVKVFFTLQLNMKIYHWNTTSFARHKASDQFGGNLLALVDKFVEIFIGRYKVKPFISDVTIDPKYINDDGSENLLIRSKKFLEGIDNNVKDTDLLNIRDELLAEINQTLYLYQLK